MTIAPNPIFDTTPQPNYPNGAWACGFQDKNRVFGNSSQEALGKWLPSQDNGKPLSGICYLATTSCIDPDVAIPTAVQFIINQQTATYIINTGTIAKTNNFSEIRCFNELANWFINESDANSQFFDMSVNEAELCVSSTHFWFSANLSGYDVNMLSEAFEINSLASYFAPNQTDILGSDSDSTEQVKRSATTQMTKTSAHTLPNNPDSRLAELRQMLVVLNAEAKELILSEDLASTGVITEHVKAVAAHSVAQHKVKTEMAKLCHDRKERFTLSKSSVGKRKHIVIDNASDPCEDPVLYRFTSKKLADDFKTQLITEHGQYFIPKK